jgi:hypothetical protein
VNFAKSYTIFPIALTAVLVQDIGRATLLIADDLPIQYWALKQLWQGVDTADVFRSAHLCYTIAGMMKRGHR